MSKIAIESPEHWHTLRAQNVGGSEVAALFGASSYMTRFQLHHYKTGTLTPDFHEENERMFWGNALEPSVIAGVGKKMGLELEKCMDYYTSDTIKGMGCTPDAILPTDPVKGRGILQIKLVDFLEWRKWEDGEPPLKFQLQVQHEIACTGSNYGVLGVLVAGNKLHLHEYPRHAATVARIEAEIAKFWQNLAAGDEPDVTGDDWDAMRELYAVQEFVVVDLSHDNELPELCAEERRQAAIRLAAEKAEKAAKARILQKTHGAGLAKCIGYEIKNTLVQRGEYTVKASSYNKLTIKEV